MMLIVVEIFSVVDSALILVEICKMIPPCSGNGHCVYSGNQDDKICLCDTGYFGKICEKGMQSA